MEQGHLELDATAVQRLALAMGVQAQKDRLRIGDQAWELLQENLTVLGVLTQSELGIGSERDTDDVPEPVVRGMRTMARFMAAVLIDQGHLGGVASEMAALVRNPGLTVADWWKVLAGRDGDPALADLAACVRYLRAGFTAVEAGKLAGVSERQYRGLAAFLGVDEWLRTRLLDAATDAVVQGQSVRGFLREYNEGRPKAERVGRDQAHRAMVAARAVLAGDDEVAA